MVIVCLNPIQILSSNDQQLPTLFSIKLLSVFLTDFLVQWKTSYTRVTYYQVHNRKADITVDKVNLLSKLPSQKNRDMWSIMFYMCVFGRVGLTFSGNVDMAEDTCWSRVRFCCFQWEITEMNSTKLFWNILGNIHILMVWFTDLFAKLAISKTKMASVKVAVRVRPINKRWGKIKSG